MVLPSMDRYFTWDEAVFYSQSGGLGGAYVDPMKLVASREIGSPALIGALRIVADGLADLRLLWAILTFLLLLLAARRLIAHIGNGAALIFLGVYGSYWLVVTFSPSFYGNTLAAVLGLLAATFYLDLLEEDTGPGLLRSSVFLGLSLAGAFAMRPLETVLLMAALAFHLALFRTRSVRRLLAPLSLAGLVWFLAVGIPWMIDSTARFGSVVGRVRSALSQSGQVASGLRFNLDEYLGVWVGDFVSQLPTAPVPYWPRFIIYSGMVAALMVIAVALRRSGRAILRGPIGVFLIAGLAHASFFLFWRAHVSDRYHFGSMIFAAAILGWALTTIKPPRLTGRGIAISAIIGSIWILPQIIIGASYEGIRATSSSQAARVATTMRILSDDGNCRAMSRYGAPQIAISSGCRVGSYTDWDEVLNEAREEPSDIPFFVYGPAREGHFEGLPEGWQVIPVSRSAETRDFHLAYRLPQNQ